MHHEHRVRTPDSTRKRRQAREPDPQLIVTVALFAVLLLLASLGAGEGSAVCR